jgi:hypothetical protein
MQKGQIQNKYFNHKLLLVKQNTTLIFQFLDLPGTFPLDGAFARGLPSGGSEAARRAVPTPA